MTHTDIHDDVSTTGIISNVNFQFITEIQRVFFSRKFKVSWHLSYTQLLLTFHFNWSCAPNDVDIESNMTVHLTQLHQYMQLL